jgi:hypothetical protein
MRLCVCGLIISFLTVACNSNTPENQQKKKDTLTLRNDPIIAKFTLPYRENLYDDTNSLIFYYTKPFDTSFLVHLRNINNEIAGTYYQTLPEFHSNLEGYSEDNIKFLLFDGFSFIIDKKIWDSIRYKANELFNKNGPVKSKVCFDCMSYFLAYNSKQQYDNKENEIYFRNLAGFLKSK